MKSFICLCLVVALSGCITQSLATYEPVVDPYSTDMNAFQADLVQCRGIASAVKAQYEKQASEQAANNLLIGVATGALVGAASPRILLIKPAALVLLRLYFLDLRLL